MRRRTLLTQVLIANLLLVVVATIAAMLVSNPEFDLGEDSTVGIVLGFAVALTVAVNVFMLSRRFEPLERLIDRMERADLGRPRANIAAGDRGGTSEEVRRLEHAFSRMLERLEAERRRVSSAALEAQERERARVARDLHDEVNQSLTALLLRLEAARTKAPPELAPELAETKALANKAMEELLQLARQLRPTALDDLGLRAALAGLVEEIGRQGRLMATFDSTGDIGSLPNEVQLVIYRVAQEALTNALQHSGATSIRIRLAADEEGTELTISDDGSGFAFEQGSGLGLAGMRERALLVGGELTIESRPELGTRVRMLIPNR